MIYEQTAARPGATSVYTHTRACARARATHAAAYDRPLKAPPRCRLISNFKSPLASSRAARSTRSKQIWSDNKSVNWEVSRYSSVICRSPDGLTPIHDSVVYSVTHWLPSPGNARPLRVVHARLVGAAIKLVSHGNSRCGQRHCRRCPQLECRHGSRV